jgi:hypothetical protein
MHLIVVRNPQAEGLLKFSHCGLMILVQRKQKPFTIVKARGIHQERAA